MAIKFLSGLNLSNVTAGSILKLDSNGNIVAAVDGTDYNTGSADSWSDVGSEIYRNSDVRIGTYQSGVLPAARLHVFDYQTTDPKLLIEDGNTGDASMRFKISTQSYTMGIDNSDSDKFVFAASSALGTTNVLEISTAGAPAFQGDLLVNGNYYLSNLWNLSAEGASYAKFSNWVRVSNTGFYTTEDVYMDLDDSSSRFVIRGTSNVEQFIVNTASDSISIPNFKLVKSGVTTVHTNPSVHADKNWYSLADAHNIVEVTEDREVYIEKEATSNGYGYFAVNPEKVGKNFDLSFRLSGGTPSSSYRHVAIAIGNDGSNTNSNYDSIVFRHNTSNTALNQIRLDVAAATQQSLISSSVPNFFDGTERKVFIQVRDNKYVIEVDGVVEHSFTASARTSDSGFVGFSIYEAGGSTTWVRVRDFNITQYSDDRTILDGNVGIGTTSPTDLLQIYGNAKYVSAKNTAGNIAAFMGTDSSGDGNFSLYQSAGGAAKIKLYAETNAVNYINNGGNFGIGTTSPFAKLNVSRAGINEGAISFDDQANNAHLVLAGTDALVRMQLGTYNNGSYGAWIQASYDNGGVNYGTEPLILNPQGGNVGIGTTSPGSLLSIRATSASHKLVRINRPNSDTAALYLGNNSSNDAIISGNNAPISLGKDVSGTYTEYVNIATDGELKFSAYGAGILKTNASGIVSVDTNTYSTATGVEDNADVTDATNVAAAGALMKAGGTMSGTLALDNADSLSFESGKHWITYNDGEGNFNIRVGHKSDSSTNEVSTETGYVFHDEWSQSSGWREFNVSGTSITAGNDVGTWRRQIFYDYNDVRLSYQGGLRLQTTSAGVTVSGNIAATNFSGSSSGTNTGDQDLSGYSTATGVEDNADVTDATNVAAAGALMTAGGTLTGGLTGTTATFSGQVIIQDNTSQPLSSLFEGTLVVQGSTNEDPIIAVTDVNTANAAAGVFHQSSTSPGFPALVINAASNGSEQPLISARTNVNNTTGIGGTEVFAVDGDGDGTFAGTVTTGGKLYIGSVAATTTAVTALLLGAAGEVKKRGLGSNAFSSTSFLPLAGGTVTGQVIFPSASTTKPVLPNGYIARNDNADTDGTHDIWGISERYYPSNSTDADAWGIQWSGTPNEINFIGAGQKKLSIDLDTAGTVKIDGNAVATESYVGTAISNLVDSSPAALDTLNELATALGNDASFSTTMSTALGNRLRIDVNNQSLSSTELANARTNLGLGTAATAASTAFVAVSGDTMTGALEISGDVGTNPILKLYNTSNSNGAIIQFSDQSNSSQTGNIDFRHADSQSQGGGASFHFTSEPDTVLVVGNNTNKGRIAVFSALSAAEVDYGFAGDVNTGMLRTSADNVSLVAGGVKGVGVGSTAVSLKYAGTTKILTSTTGITVTGEIVTTGGNSTNWNTAYTYSQVGHLPLAGGNLTGNLGINSSSPAAPLDVQPASNYKVTKVGDDRTSHYKFTGQSDHTLTLSCSSYHSAEVVITAHQTNGGTNNNVYIRGIWTNNHTSHHWHEIENIGGLSGSSFTITNGQSGDTTNSGELEIVHDYTTGSFAQMVARVTDHYGTHSYTIS